MELSWFISQAEIPQDAGCQVIEMEHHTWDSQKLSTMRSSAVKPIGYWLLPKKNTDTIWEECQGVSRNVTSTVHWSNHDWEIILVFVLLLLLLYYYCTINMSIVKDLLPFWQQVLWFQPLLRYNRSIMSIELWPHGVKMSPMASAVTWQSGDHGEWGFIGTLSQAGTSYWGDFQGQLNIVSDSGLGNCLLGEQLSVPPFLDAISTLEAADFPVPLWDELWKMRIWKDFLSSLTIFALICMCK